MEPRTTTLIALAALALAGCGSTFTSTPATPPVEPAARPEPTDTAEPDPVTLTVFYPGSLIIPFDAVRAAFEARYPHVDVHMEGHGSIQVMRHATELDDLMDVAVVADHTLIPGMMYPNTAPETGLPMADWTIEFATNRMVLAYTLESKYAGEIAPDNWYQILARRDVRKAMSDPRFDAAGYRSLMVLQLAEIATDRITILDNVMMGRFTNAITTEESGDRFIIHVPEVLQPKAGSDILVRSYSVQLIALLEAREVDYAFAYQTVAEQHRLEYVALPDELNLGNEIYSDTYGRVEVQLDFQRFATVLPQFTGQVIGYGLTIPSNAPHPEMAEIFVAWLLGPEGRAVMDESGHPMFDQPRTDAWDRLPEGLRDLAVPAGS